MKHLRDHHWKALPAAAGEGMTNMPSFDQGYSEFLTEMNGGAFFEGALILYGNSEQAGFDLQTVNALMQELYGKLVERKFFFGQDILGLQYYLDVKKKVVGQMNIETGEMEVIARHFPAFLAELENDLDYLTGLDLLRDYVEENGPLEFGARLCPMKPFVIGGEYEVSNLKAKNALENLKINAFVYHKIKDLPDGANVSFKP
ncbi:MAG: hypothetical protein AAF570_14180 [Bacteroidota bacterium]